MLLNFNAFNRSPVMPDSSSQYADLSNVIQTGFYALYSIQYKAALFLILCMSMIGVFAYSISTQKNLHENKMELVKLFAIFFIIMGLPVTVGFLTGLFSL